MASNNDAASCGGCIILIVLIGLCIAFPPLLIVVIPLLIIGYFTKPAKSQDELDLEAIKKELKKRGDL